MSSGVVVGGLTTEGVQMAQNKDPIETNHSVWDYRMSITFIYLTHGTSNVSTEPWSEDGVI